MLEGMIATELEKGEKSGESLREENRAGN